VPITEQLNTDLRDALRAGDERLKTTIRLILASIHYAEIEAGHSLDEAATNAVLTREARQRRESIEEYGKAGRGDLVAKEEAELAIISGYLPPQLSRDQIFAAAREVIERVGAKGPADKGRVMPVIIAELRGKADGREINAVVSELLG